MKRHITALAGIILVLALPARPTGATAQTAAGVASLRQCQGVTDGTVHVVDSPEGPVTSVEPPAGFTPGKATGAELRCYGFPERPADPQQLAQWRRVIGRPRHYVVPQFGPPMPPRSSAPVNPSAPSSASTSPAPAAAGQTGSGTITPYTVSGSPVKDYYVSCSVGSSCSSAPWAGYAIPRSKNGWTNLQWTETWGDWTVPYGHTYCTNATVSPWVGMGGDGWDGGNGNALIQAGTDTWNSSPTPGTEFWWEDWNYNGAIPITNIAVKQGEEVFIDVKYNGNYTSTFQFQNQTEYTNFTTPAEYTPNVDLSSADYITENIPNPDYVRFGTMTFEWEGASGTWGSGYSITKDVTQANITEFDTYNNSSYSLEEQYPWDLGIGSSADGFYVSSTGNAGC